MQKSTPVWAATLVTDGFDATSVPVDTRQEPAATSQHSSHHNATPSVDVAHRKLDPTLPLPLPLPCPCPQYKHAPAPGTKLAPIATPAPTPAPKPAVTPALEPASAPKPALLLNAPLIMTATWPGL